VQCVSPAVPGFCLVCIGNNNRVLATDVEMMEVHLFGVSETGYNDYQFWGRWR